MTKLTKEAKRRGWTEAHLKKEWVGLTDEEMSEIWMKSGWYVTMFKEVEAKLKEKNT